MIFLRNSSYVIFYLVALILSTPLSARSYAMTEVSVSKIAVKLTYNGPQNKTVPSLVFIETDCATPIQEFKDLNLYYSNDEDLKKILSVSHATMERIDAAIPIEPVEDEIEEDRLILSIVVLFVDSKKYRIINLSKQKAINITSRIYDAIANEEEVRETFDIWLNRTNLKEDK